MSGWEAHTNQFAALNFKGGCIIDKASYAVLAQFGDAIPRGYQLEGADVNENLDLQQDWKPETFTGLRFNQVRYMILRKEQLDDTTFFMFGKKGGNGVFAFEGARLWLILVSDQEKLPMEQANIAAQEYYQKTLKGHL